MNSARGLSLPLYPQPHRVLSPFYPRSLISYQFNWEPPENLIVICQGGYSATNSCNCCLNLEAGIGARRRKSGEMGLVSLSFSVIPSIQVKTFHPSRLRARRRVVSALMDDSQSNSQQQGQLNLSVLRFTLGNFIYVSLSFRVEISNSCSEGKY